MILFIDIIFHGSCLIFSLTLNTLYWIDISYVHLIILNHFTLYLFTYKLQVSYCIFCIVCAVAFIVQSIKRVVAHSQESLSSLTVCIYKNFTKFVSIIFYVFLFLLNITGYCHYWDIPISCILQCEIYIVKVKRDTGKSYSIFFR